MTTDTDSITVNTRKHSLTILTDTEKRLIYVKLGNKWEIQEKFYIKK